MGNKVVYKIRDTETREVLYIGSGNEARPERSKPEDYLWKPLPAPTKDEK